MLVCGTVIPDEVLFGVVGFVVEYRFYDRNGSIKRRKGYYDLGEAIEKFNSGIRFLYGSTDFEEVILYYYHDDKKLHKIKSYDTCNGMIESGEQS